MAAISTHCHQKSYQIATTNDPALPLRKWYHRGTHWGVTAKDVLCRLFGTVGEHCEKTGHWKCGELYVQTSPGGPF